METREIYWNIQGIWIMYALTAIALAVFCFGVYRHYRLLAQGKPEDRFGRPSLRLVAVIRHGLAQIRGLRDRYSGLMHLLFFWGFIALFVGTLIVFVQADLGIPIMYGPLYLYFQSLTLDILGLLAVAGLGMALTKRYIARPDRLVNPERHRTLLDDGVILGLFLAILVTGFLIEGLRIAATSDPWGAWSPVGNAIAAMLSGLRVSASSVTLAHGILWWFHLVIALAFIAYIPYSKLRHLLLSPANIYFRSMEPMGVLKPIDIEKAETLGTPKLQDMTWKQLLDLASCMECGRCQKACPAYAAGQPLSPKAVILDLRAELYGSAFRPGSSRRRGSAGASPLLNVVSWCLRRFDRDPTDSVVTEGGDAAPTISAVTTDALWSCVTCGACMRECPVFIEHIPTIVDMRRYLVMEQAEYPDLMQEAVGSMEARGHPFRGTTASRTDWVEGLGVKVVAESGPAEWLYWVGCAAALDERSQRIARAFATLLQRAGVDFAILGEEESCTGDVARRIGNEYLYQMMAQQNVGLLNGYEITKIITTCPHCYNTLKNEYPQFGGNYEVYHHTELLEQLLKDGRLQPSEQSIKSITFHDPCYLARHNGMVDPPRRLLSAAPGLRLVEMERRGDKTFCCGAGGGHLWFEEIKGRRINHERTAQALSLETEAVGTACPFCMIMMTDGVKSLAGDRTTAVLDVAEILEAATRPETGTRASSA